MAHRVDSGQRPGERLPVPYVGDDRPDARRGRCAGTPTCADGSRASNTTASCPDETRALTISDPMNPAPPVTSTRMDATLGPRGAREPERRPHVTGP